MELSFRRANPKNGQQSCVLKFESDSWSQTPCVLIDAGPRVDIEECLTDDEYLAGVLLTHAHTDHFASLNDILVDRSPIYTSEDTASILQLALEQFEGGERFNSYDIEQIVSQVTAVSEWETIFGEVNIRPINTGHAPGACGFLLRFPGETEKKHVLITGDFTIEDVAGYPGIGADFPVNIDVVFLNRSLNSEAHRDTTPAIREIIEQQNKMNSTLVSTTGLTGVQFAYILGNYAAEQDAELTINVVGQVAKYYSALEYDVPNVVETPTFKDVESVLSEGDVWIAAPPNRSTGSSSGKLYQAVRSRSDVSVIQISGMEKHTRSENDTGKSKVESVFTQINHPSRSQVDDFVRNIKPIHIVALHSTDTRVRDQYTFSYTWLDKQPKEYVLYDGVEWTAPGWVSEKVQFMIESNNPVLAAEDAGFQAGNFGEFRPYGRRKNQSLRTEMVSLSELPKLNLRAKNKQQITEEPPTTPDVVPDVDAKISASSSSPTNQESKSESRVLKVRVVDMGSEEYLLKLIEGDLQANHGDVITVERGKETLEKKK